MGIRPATVDHGATARSATGAVGAAAGAEYLAYALVEAYFKALKTGCAFEKRRLTTRCNHREGTAREHDKPARTPKTTEQLLARAAHAGRHVGSLCGELHRSGGETGVRKILGVLALAKKYGAPALDAACGTAIDLGAPNYRFVRRFLERQPGPAITLRQIDPLIRELTQYRQLIDHMTNVNQEPATP